LKKKSKLLNQRYGFSLLELMVAVAIIGILAVIGITNYGKTRARTRQSEAKASLSTIFVAEASFFGEWSQYTVDLQNIGFGVYGTRLRYITGFYSGSACTGYSTTLGAPAELTTFSNTWSCGANVNAAGVGQAVNWMLPATITMVANQCTSNPPALSGTVSACDNTLTSQGFTAIAIGDPNSDVGQNPLDGWAINNGKFLSNTTSGIE
jgi:prepilin-type N-terminal cleavage/methylation domain-containing protein